jgi:uncharacterized protein HemX
VKTLTAAIIAASLCLGAGVARAQQTTASSEQARAALNSQQAAAAEQQNEQNIENRRDYDQAMAERRADLRRERRAEASELAAYGAQLDEYHAAMRQWRTDVAACHAGDTARCAPLAP